MTASQRISASELALLARSIMSCPGGISLLVDGIEHATGCDCGLILEDHNGIPAFTCPAGSPLHLAGQRQRPARVEVSSGLAEGDPWLSVVLSGDLLARGAEELMGGDAQVVVLQPSRVLLVRRGGQTEIAPEHYACPDHSLNPGFLQRSREHANSCHQEELRQSVARSTGIAPGRIAGVTLSGLSAAGVELRWVDHDGSHERVLRFTRPARSPAELGHHLRHELHAGIC